MDGANLLTGSIALIVAHEDVVSVAKIIAETAKAGPEKLIIRGGRISGQLLNQARVQELASLPSKLQLIANLIGVLESPISDLIFVLEQTPSDLVFTIEEASKKAPAAPAAGAPAAEAPPASPEQTPPAAGAAAA